MTVDKFSLAVKEIINSFAESGMIADTLHSLVPGRHAKRLEFNRF